MLFLNFFIPFSLLLVLVVVFVISKYSKKCKPYELILLGLEVTLIGIYLAITPNFDILGYDLIVVALGLGISLSSFFVKNR